MLSSIRSNQPYANEPVYILEHQWPRCWMAENITNARIVRGRVRESTTAHDHGFTGITWSTNPCRWRHRRWHGVLCYCPYPETTSATDSLPELSALPKASASMARPRSPTPPTANWSWSSSSGDGDDNNYRGVVDDCSDAVVHHVRRAMNTCCRDRVANEVRACFGIVYSCEKPWSLRFWTI